MTARIRNRKKNRTTAPVKLSPATGDTTAALFHFLNAAIKETHAA